MITYCTVVEIQIRRLASGRGCPELNPSHLSWAHELKARQRFRRRKKTNILLPISPRQYNNALNPRLIATISLHNGTAKPHMPAHEAGCKLAHFSVHSFTLDFIMAAEHCSPVAGVCHSSPSGNARCNRLEGTDGDGTVEYGRTINH